MSRVKHGLLALCLVLFSLQSQAEEVITFGIVPQQSASKLAKLWVPILAEVSRQTGYKLQFKTAPNIPEFEQRCANGEYDVAYMNPYHYTVFSRSPGYQAIARQKDKLIRGIVVVHKDSPIKEMSELHEKVIAFPAPAAFAASVLPRAYLTAQNIPFSPEYVSSHDSVYRTVAKGLFTAGGGIERTFNNMAPEIRNELKILWTTDAFTPHAFATHPRLPAEVVTKIQQALVDLDKTDAGAALLKEINFKAIQASQDRDWDDVRALGIDLLEQLIKG